MKCNPLARLATTTLAAVCIAAFCVTLAATAPATLLDTALRIATDARCRLAESHGTIWHGRAIPVCGDALPAIAWRVDPAALLLARLAITVDIAAGTHQENALQARLIVAATGTTLAAEGRLPATLLVRIFPRAAATSPDGQIEINAPALRHDPAGFSGHATLIWHEARVATAGGTPLGTYRLDLYGEGKSLTGRVSTLNGPLDIEGTLQWSPGSALKARFQAEPLTSDPRIDYLLNLAGQRVAGSKRIEILI